MLSITARTLARTSSMLPSAGNRGIFNSALSRAPDQITLSPCQDQELANNWDYPSDHLPQFFHVCGLNLATWNIFNSIFAHHITREPWQKGGYMSAEKELSDKYLGFSRREEQCCDKIKQLMEGNCSLDILCIQECSTKMFQLLQNEFANTGVVVTRSQAALLPGGKDVNNHVASLIKPSRSLKLVDSFSYTMWKRKYVKADSKTLANPKGVEEFGWDEWRPGLISRLEYTPFSKKIYSIVLANIHISCAGEKPNYKIERANELWDKLNTIAGKKDMVICTGDYNMTKSLRQNTKLAELRNFAEQCSHVDAKEPEILSIDDMLVNFQDSKMGLFSGSITLKEKDDLAYRVHQNALKPIINETRFRKLIGF